MEPAALPTNEAERLHALMNLHVLDTLPEERYDRIVRLVASHFEVPFAAINMIAADRQWTKSSVGDLQREIPRNSSFCSYTVLSGDLFVIEDIVSDPRFNDNPLVVGPPHLRFYAAAPLHSYSGHVVGALCILGTQSRNLSLEEEQQLKDFAMLVERELGTTELEAALAAQDRTQARFRAAAEANLDSFLILESLRDSRGKIVDFIITYANSRVEQIVARPQSELVGQQLCDLLPYDRTYGFFEKYVKVVETGVPIEEEFESNTLDPQPFWTHHQIVPLGDGVAITSRDVTARRKVEENMARTNTQLQEAVQRLERRTRDIMLLNELGELLLSCRTIDEVGNVVALSLRTLLSRTMGVLYLEDSSGMPLPVVATWGGYPADEPLVRDSCWALRRQRVHYVSAGREELFCRHSKNDHRYESLCIPLRSQGRLLGLLHVLSIQIGDTSVPLEEAQRQLAMTVAEWTSLALANLMLQRELRQQALRDPLTGLYNRRYFEQLVPQILADAAINGHPASVIAIDIDHFKQVNDRNGHAVGDQVLQAVGRLLQTSLSEGWMACRVGGEEFLLVLPRSTCEEAAELAEQLRAKAHTLHQTNVPTIPAITISSGVATFPQHGEEVAPLVATADAALYRAKVGGRNRVVMAE